MRALNARRRLAAVSLMSLAALAAPIAAAPEAAKPATATVASTAAAKAPADKPSSFGETTQVVSVEVPVTAIGRDGLPVRGLKAEDFEIQDEGVAQKVSSFDVVDLAVTAPADGGSAAAEQVMADAGRRRFMLLFDLTFSTPGALLKARIAARDFILNALRPGDLAGVGTISVEQGFRPVVAFTTDRAQIARGIDTLGYHSDMSYTRVDPLHFVITPPSEQIRDLIESDKQAFLGARRSGADEEAKEYLASLAVAVDRDQRNFDRGRITKLLHMLGGLAHGLSSLQGRKNILYFSEGFDSQLLVGRDVSKTEDQQEEAQYVENGDIWRVDTDQRFGNSELQNVATRVLEEFRRSDCVIQAIDIGGLRADVDPSKQRTGQDALFFMANESGGELFKNANNLRTELDHVLERSSLTYLLTFERDDVKADGKYHRLKVRAKLPPGAHLSARAGYYAPRPYRELSPLERNLLASDSIARAEPRRDVGVHVLAAPFRAGAARAYVPVIIEIDGSSLLAGQTGEHMGVEIYAYASDRTGQMRDFHTQVVGFDLTKARTAIEHAGVKYYGHLELPPGDYLLRVLVRNAETVRGGVEAVHLNVPDYAAPVLLPPFFFESPGRWVMVREPSHEPATESVVYPFVLNGDPYVPAVRPEIPTASPAKLCLVAYNLSKAAPKVDAEIIDTAGRTVSTGRVALLERAVTGVGGYDQLLASFDARGLLPGSYTLQIGLVDGETGSKQVNRIAFAVPN